MHLTDSEINRRLAKALGWPFISWERFSPATDSNDLREYVLPEVERRGQKVKYAMCEILNKEYDIMVLDHYDAMWDALTAEPRVLALAALRVLEGDQTR